MFDDQIAKVMPFLLKQWADFLEMFLRGPKLMFAAWIERRERDPAYLAERELSRRVAPAEMRAGPSTGRRVLPTTRSVITWLPEVDQDLANTTLREPADAEYRLIVPR